jgi:hypothetical protein
MQQSVAVRIFSQCCGSVQSVIGSISEMPISETLYRIRQYLVPDFSILNLQGGRGRIMDNDKNLAREVEEIEQVVNALGKSVAQVLSHQALILQNQAVQSEILNKILTQVVPPGPGLISTQKMTLEPPK